MKRNLLVLLTNEEPYIELKKQKTAYYRESGDYSVYLIPPVLILGKTKYSKIDRMSINTNVVLEETTTSSSIGTILPFVNLEEFQALYNKYEVDIINGFYICEKQTSLNIKLPKITKLKLALLKYTPEGYILLQ